MECHLGLPDHSGLMLAARKRLVAARQFLNRQSHPRPSLDHQCGLPNAADPACAGFRLDFGLVANALHDRSLLVGRFGAWPPLLVVQRVTEHAERAGQVKVLVLTVLAGPDVATLRTMVVAERVVLIGPV